jgi:SAM-dependent methyltransferase
MISPNVLGLARCPRCVLAGRELLPLCQEGDSLRCPACGERYTRTDDALDLRPPAGVDGRETDYVAHGESFAEKLDYRAVGEPLLGAAVRYRWLRRWVPLGPGQLVLDIGAGDGRFALWGSGRGARIIALDPAPFFADRARAEIDLTLGDARALPFPSGAFDAVYSIDVMEHLDEPGLARFFAEASRVLKPGGRFYLYSNTRERPTLWPIVGLWGWLSRQLRRRQIGDFAIDDLRKGDHIKVLATWEELVAFVARYHLRVEDVRFWNGVFQGLVDNVLIRLGEGLLLGKRASSGGVARQITGSERQSPAQREQDAPLSSRQQLSRRRGLRLALRVLTALMQLDIILFGRLRAGPFFALLRKDGTGSQRGDGRA